MLEFKKLQLGDIDGMRAYFKHSVNRICDNTAGGMVMWRDYFSSEYAEYDETIVFKANIKHHGNLTAFSMPLGENVRGCIEKIVEYCNKNGIKVAFSSVTSEDIEILKTVFRDFDLLKCDGWGDYVYRADDLVGLSGRKFHGQRNHINYFKRTYTNHVFEEISPDNIGHVRDFYLELSKSMDFSSRLAVEDHKITLEVLDNFEAYGFFGGLLRVSGAVVAFSVGDINNGVLFIHIEKADLRFRGAYQVISNEFARRYATSGVEFINREEDLGDAGLRISKESYHPSEILEKYIFFVLYY